MSKKLDGEAIVNNKQEDTMKTEYTDAQLDSVIDRMMRSDDDLEWGEVRIARWEVIEQLASRIKLSFMKRDQANRLTKHAKQNGDDELARKHKREALEFARETKILLKIFAEKIHE